MAAKTKISSSSEEMEKEKGKTMEGAHSLSFQNRGYEKKRQGGAFGFIVINMSPF